MHVAQEEVALRENKALTKISDRFRTPIYQEVDHRLRTDEKVNWTAAHAVVKEVLRRYTDDAEDDETLVCIKTVFPPLMNIMMACDISSDASSGQLTEAETTVLPIFSSLFELILQSVQQSHSHMTLWLHAHVLCHILNSYEPLYQMEDTGSLVDWYRTEVVSQYLAMTVARDLPEEQDQHYLVQQLRQSPWIGCSTANCLLRPFEKIAEAFSQEENAINPPAWINLISIVYDVLHEKLRTLTGEILRREDPDVVANFTGIMETLLLSCGFSFYDTSRRIYQFRLDFSLVCLQCEYLDKRLYGLKEINQLIQRAVDDGVTATGIPNSCLAFDIQQNRHWIEPKNVLAFILENHIIDQFILGPHHLHLELLSRSTTLFGFLLSHSKVKESTLRLLWHASIGKHERMTAEVYLVIVYLITHPGCTAQERIYFVRQFPQVIDPTRQEFRHLMLELAKTCGGHVGTSDVELSQVYIESLWHMLHHINEKTATKDSSNVFIEILIYLFHHSDLDDLRLKLCHECVEYIRSSTSSMYDMTLSMLILEKLLLLHSSHSSSMAGRVRINSHSIESFENQEHLIDLALHKIALNSKKSTIPVAQLLHLISIVLNNSSIQLTLGQFQRLWSSIISSHQGALLRWIGTFNPITLDSKTPSSRAAIIRDLSLQDFTARCCQLFRQIPLHLVLEVSFFTFQQLVIRKLEGIDNTADDLTNVMMKNDIDIKHIWKIYAESSDKVASQAEKLLVYLHQIHDSDKSSSHAMTVDFIDGIFIRLQTIFENQSAQDRKQTTRLLHLLHFLLEQQPQYHGYNIVRSHQVLTSCQSIQVRFRIHLSEQHDMVVDAVDNNEVIQNKDEWVNCEATFASSEWIGRIRHHLRTTVLASMFSDDQSDHVELSLVSDFTSHLLTQDFETLSHYAPHMDDIQPFVLYVRVIHHSTTATSTTNTPSMYKSGLFLDERRCQTSPHLIVAYNVEYFQLLFRALEVNALQKLAWNIVCSIPPHFQSIIELSNPNSIDNWMAWMRLESDKEVERRNEGHHRNRYTFQSLYYLQLLKFMLCPPPDMLESCVHEDHRPELLGCLWEKKNNRFYQRMLNSRKAHMDDDPVMDTENEDSWSGFSHWRQQFFRSPGWEMVCQIFQDGVQFLLRNDSDACDDEMKNSYHHFSMNMLHLYLSLFIIQNGISSSLTPPQIQKVEEGAEDILMDLDSFFHTCFQLFSRIQSNMTSASSLDTTATPDLMPNTIKSLYQLLTHERIQMYVCGSKYLSECVKKCWSESSTEFRNHHCTFLRVCVEKSQKLEFKSLILFPLMLEHFQSLLPVGHINCKEFFKLFIKITPWVDHLTIARLYSIVIQRFYQMIKMVEQKQPSGKALLCNYVQAIFQMLKLIFIKAPHVVLSKSDDSNHESGSINSINEELIGIQEHLLHYYLCPQEPQSERQFTTRRLALDLIRQIDQLCFDNLLLTDTKNINLSKVPCRLITQLTSSLKTFHQNQHIPSSLSKRKQHKSWLWNIDRGSHLRHSSKSIMNNDDIAASFSGLVNLGCTCYINSLLQQLFMIPDFRHGILHAQINDKAKTELLVSKGTPYATQLEVFLRELQNLFFQLHYCKSKVNPTAFVHCLMNSSEESSGSFFTLDSPILEQNDASEFFNVLFDRLDMILAVTQSHSSLLKSCFGGKISHQLVGNGHTCLHSCEREELFYSLTLEVKHKESLEDALELFVEQELLEGENAYFCDKCQAKVDTIKRCVIQDLPQTLILHLKRFEIDFDRFDKVKLNDYYQFPVELNMKTYMKRSNPEEANEDEIYVLQGILVHSGTAHSGHYYSYIQERKHEDLDTPGWYEFNDDRVTHFSPENIARDCFGGTFLSQVAGGECEFVNEQNAFMLIYEKAENIQRCPRNIKEDDEVVQKNAFYQEIIRYHQNCLRQEYLFSPVYTGFLQECLQFQIQIFQPQVRSSKSNEQHQSLLFCWRQVGQERMQLLFDFYLSTYIHLEDAAEHSFEWMSLWESCLKTSSTSSPAAHDVIQPDMLEWIRTERLWKIHHQSTIQHLLEDCPFAFLRWNGYKFLDWIREDRRPLPKAFTQTCLRQFNTCFFIERIDSGEIGTVDKEIDVPAVLITSRKMDDSNWIIQMEKHQLSLDLYKTLVLSLESSEEEKLLLDNEEQTQLITNCWKFYVQLLHYSYVLQKPQRCWSWIMRACQSHVYNTCPLLRTLMSCTCSDSESDSDTESEEILALFQSYDILTLHDKWMKLLVQFFVSEVGVPQKKQNKPQIGRSCQKWIEQHMPFYDIQLIHYWTTILIFQKAQHPNAGINSTEAFLMHWCRGHWSQSGKIIDALMQHMFHFMMDARFHSTYELSTYIELDCHLLAHLMSCQDEFQSDRIHFTWTSLLRNLRTSSSSWIRSNDAEEDSKPEILCRTSIRWMVQLLLGDSILTSSSRQWMEQHVDEWHWILVWIQSREESSIGSTINDEHHHEESKKRPRMEEDTATVLLQEFIHLVNTSSI